MSEKYVLIANAIAYKVEFAPSSDTHLDRENLDDMASTRQASEVIQKYGLKFKKFK